MKRFDRLKHFTGRADEIAAFEALASGDGEAWALLVDGLSGTGKSTLADWLLRERCEGLPTAKITLEPGLTADTLVSGIARQLSAEVGDAVDDALDHIFDSDAPIKLVAHQSIEKTGMGGSVSGNAQSIGDIRIDASFLQPHEDAQTTRMIRALLRMLRPFYACRWVLVFDQTEHLEDPTLRALVLGRLLTSLRTRCPELRVLLTGQSVPMAAFEPHEYVHRSLDSFDADTVAELMIKVGHTDKASHARALELTLGHPILLGMWLQASPDEAEPGSSSVLDESSRTRWIYDRLIQRLPAGVVRQVASELALFDWFDLELLRTVFEADISADEFRILVERAFVKPLDAGRWTCHEIVREHLPAHRRQFDPTRFINLHDAAAGALLDRLGSDQSADELPVLTSALSSMQIVDTADAQSLARAEFARMFAYGRPQSAYALSRHLAAHRFAPWGPPLARQVRRALVHESAMSLAADHVAFLAGLTEGAKETDADLLLHAAAHKAFNAGRHAVAVDYATRALALDDDPYNRLILAESLAATGDHEAADEHLRLTRERHGDSVMLRLCELRILDSRDAHETIEARLDAMLDAFPDDASAWIANAQRLVDRGEVGAAERALERALACEPANKHARKLLLDILVTQDRLEQARQLWSQIHDLDYEEIEVYAALSRSMSDPLVAVAVERRLVDEDPSLSLAEIDIWFSALAQHGDVERTDGAARLILARWPELSANVVAYRAMARLVADRPAEAVSMLEPSVDMGSACLSAPWLLIVAYGKLGDSTGQERVLTRAIDAGTSPLLFDECLAVAVHDAAEAEFGAAGLALIDRVVGTTMPGPKTLQAKAAILRARGDVDEAIETLSQLRHTFAVDEFGLETLATIHTELAALLIRAGRVDEALDVAQDLLELFPGADMAVSGAARIYIESGRLERAHELWRGAPRLTRPRLLILEMLAEKTLAGRPTAEALASEFRARPERIDLFLALYALASTDEASKHVEAVRGELDQLCPEWHTLAQEIQLLSAQQPTPALVLRMTRDWVAAEPSDSWRRHAFFDNLLRLRKLDEALAEYDQMLCRGDGEPLVLRARHRVTRALLKSGRVEEARRVLAPELEADEPGVEMGLLVLGLFHALEDHEAAARHVDRLVGKVSGRARVDVLLGSALALAKPQPERARVLLAEFFAAAEFELERALDGVYVYVLLEQYAEALAWLDTHPVDHTTPARVRAKYNEYRGGVLFWLDRLDEAEACLRAALELAPRSSDVRVGLAKVLETGERWAEAYVMASEALALNPDLHRDNEEWLASLRAHRDTPNSAE